LLCIRRVFWQGIGGRNSVLAGQTELSGVLPATAPPERVAVTQHGAALVMTFAGGATRVVTAPRLRLACRCAHCARARIDGIFAQSFDSVAIQTISPMGHYGINVGFSDGHSRGIYPWHYLAALTDQ
jgi:DUF971 family protein